jgi:hypothetical protein
VFDEYPGMDDVMTLPFKGMYVNRKLYQKKNYKNKNVIIKKQGMAQIGTK